MHFINTSQYDEAEVRRLVEIGIKGVNMTGIGVLVEDSVDWRSYYGRAYGYNPTHLPFANNPDIRRVMTVAIGRSTQFPAHNMWTHTRWTRSLNNALRLADKHGGRHIVDIDNRGNPRYGYEFRAPYGGVTSPRIDMADWREAVVAVAAHEARHMYQFAHAKPMSEVDCERFAARALDRYRAGRAITGELPEIEFPHRPTGAYALAAD